MKIKVAVFSEQEVDLIGFLGSSDWSYDIIFGDWVDKYYLGEIDDILLEVLQDTSIGIEATSRSLLLLKCNGLLNTDREDPPLDRALIFQYIQDNIHRVVPTHLIEDLM